MATYTEDQIKGMSYEQLLQLLRQNAAVNSDGQMLDGGRAAIDVGGTPYELGYQPDGSLRLWRETGTAANGDETNRGYQIAPDGSVVRPWSDYTSSDQTMHAVSGLAGLGGLVGAGALLAPTAGVTGTTGGALTGSGFVGEGAASGIPAWDAAVGSQVPLAGVGAGAASGAGFVGEAPWAPTAGTAAGTTAATQTGTPNLPVNNPSGAPVATNPSLLPDWARSLAPFLPLAAGAAAAADSGPETVTQIRDLPAWAQPYAQNYMTQAQQVASRPYQDYTGQRVADWNNDQNLAASGVRTSAIGGNPVVNAAQTQQMGNIAGNFMQDPRFNQTTPVGTNPFLNKDNPYLQNAIDLAVGDVSRNFYNNTLPGVQSAFNVGGGNNFNSSARAYQEEQAREAAARTAGNISSSMRMDDIGRQMGLNEADIARQMGAFQTDANRNLSGLLSGLNIQQSASQFSPQFQNADFDRWRTLSASGADQNAYQQSIINADMNRFNQAWQYPYQQLNTLASGFPAYAGTSSGSTTTPGTNPWIAGIGGLTTGMGIYGQGRTYGWW